MKGKSRAGDSKTSKAAAKETSSAESIRTLIKLYLFEHRNGTTHEIAAHYNLDLQSTTTRLNELFEAGDAVKIPHTRTNSSGKKAYIWRATKAKEKAFILWWLRGTKASPETMLKWLVASRDKVIEGKWKVSHEFEEAYARYERLKEIRKAVENIGLRKFMKLHPMPKRKK